MSKITRETLLKNLQAHDESEHDRSDAVWDKVMQKFDAATKRGERSICVSYETHEFSTTDLEYIKQRAVKEGMSWHRGELQDRGYDASAYIVIKF